MPTLADIYSAINTAKRKGTDFVQNPSTSLQQMLGNANDKARGFNQLNDQALAELEQTGQLSGPAGQQLMGTVGGALNPAGMTVFHGSPYKFNQFDASKIGKGEGAQAYGHGLYVAENPAVAKQYQQNVKDLDSIQSYNQRLKQLSKMMEEDSMYPGAYRKFKSEKGSKAADEYDALMEMRNQKSTAKGNLYKVDLPDEHIEKMLDWDKPLSQQPKNVQDALAQLGIKVDKKKLNEFDDALLEALTTTSPTGKLPRQPLDLTGEQILKEFERNPSKYFSNAMEGKELTAAMINPRAGASQLLHKKGIPGVKYYDQTSRNNKEGTRNFVIFPGNEHILSIQDINGQLLK